MKRRNFLKKSLIAAGMVAVPATLISRVIAEPVDPAKEYHLNMCRELYRQYPLTPNECYKTIKYGDKTFHFKIIKSFSNPPSPYKNKRDGHMNIDYGTENNF